MFRPSIIILIFCPVELEKCDRRLAFLVECALRLTNDGDKASAILILTQNIFYKPFFTICSRSRMKYMNMNFCMLVDGGVLWGLFNIVVPYGSCQHCVYLELSNAFCLYILLSPFWLRLLFNVEQLQIPNKS